MPNKRENQRIISFPVRENVDVRIAVSRINKSVWMEKASELDRSLVSTILFELGTNIIKYADYGYLHVEFRDESDNPWLEIRAQDDGPGIADIGLALRDHYTTGNTLGLGLPGVRRMADSFEIKSSPGKGTTVVATKGLGGRPPKKKKPWLVDQRTADVAALPPSSVSRRSSGPAKQAGNWEIGTYTRPLPGQIRGGDLAISVEGERSLLMVMVDVTGHGERAFELCNRIKPIVLANSAMSLRDLMQLLHQNLAGTIGAAIGMLRIDLQNAEFSYIGVGNTGIARASGERWRGVSRDGLVGSRLPNLMQQDGKLAPGDAFLMWTDGMPEIEAPKYLAQYPNESAKRIVSQIVHSLGKSHDDAGCIVFRWIR